MAPYCARSPTGFAQSAENIIPIRLLASPDPQTTVMNTRKNKNAVRYNGRCSLWNTRIIGEIFTEGLTDISGRAPCPTTLWAYEQKKGKISAQELVDQEINFDGTLHIDGYWVKSGWRKYIEGQLGRTLTNR